MNSLEVEIPRGLKPAFDYLESMLVMGESLEASSVQRRIYAGFRRRALIAATSGRFIGLNRGLFGQRTTFAFRWQDIKTIDIYVGIFGSSLTVTYLDQPDLASEGHVRNVKFRGMAKKGTQAVYRICQAQEQAWREKRRLRDLEEMRARSGGFQTGGLSPALFGARTDQTPDTVLESPLERLQKAKKMLAEGLITDSEYETIKARIVNTI